MAMLPRRSPPIIAVAAIWLRAAQQMMTEGTFEGNSSFLRPSSAQRQSDLLLS